jgi:aconitate hydratase
LQFLDGVNAPTSDLDGSETYSVLGLGDSIRPRQQVTLQIARKDGKTEQVPLILRIDTPIEVEYYRHGGILPFVLRDILQSKSSAA